MDTKICKSEIRFGDDFGDNPCTFHCELRKGHKGKHQETGRMYNQQRYKVVWDNETIKEEFNEDRFKE